MQADEWIDGEWIRERLRTTEKTQRDLARALQIDASGVSRLLDGRRKLRADELRVVRAFFDDAAPGAPSPASEGRPDGGRGGPGSSGRAAPGPRPRNRLAADIPIYGSLLPDRQPFFHLPGGMPAEYRPCPPQCAGVPGAFGLFIPDDSLAPRVRAGEVVYVHPGQPSVVGADVFVRFREPGERVAILRCVAVEAEKLRFIPVNADPGARRIAETCDLRRGELAQIGRIVLIATA